MTSMISTYRRPFSSVKSPRGILGEPTANERHHIAQDSRSSRSAHLLQERVRESLNPKLEGPIVRRLVQALHLLRHERLVDELTL
jgi:hypothetical protein